MATSPFGGQTTEVLKGADMLADGGGKVLCLHKPYILAARVSQDVAEGMHAAPAFGGEGDLVRRIIHLSLQPLSRFKPLHGWFRQMRPECAQPLAHNRVAALEAQAPQLLMQPHRSEMGVAFHQLRNLIRKRVQQAGPRRALLFRGARAAILVRRQCLGHALSSNAQQARNAALRSAAIVQSHDLVARELLHRCSSSPTKSWLNAATEPASRANLWKRGSRITRSSGVSPVRP